MTTSVLVFILKNDKVLLGRRKKKYAFGKWNGYGGRVEENESLLHAAVREVIEESGLHIKEEDLIKHAEFEYTEPDGDWVVYIFLCKKFENEPIESDEMQPEWFYIDNLPYNEMWDNDKLWLTKILKDKKLLKGTFKNDADGNLMEHKIVEVENLT